MTIRRSEKVLIVDDDELILKAYRRNLARALRVDTAPGGREGLEMIRNNGPYAVVISDLRMPGMDGIQFLSKVREIAPDTVRIMLTGYADLKNAIDTINRGQIFRFLTKPCELHDLYDAIYEGLKFYRIVTAEKELLEKTLTGVVKTLTDLFSVISPEAIVHASRILYYVKKIAEIVGYRHTWQLETAAGLALLGTAFLPREILKKVNTGKSLSEEELQTFMKHPAFGSKLIGNIPRLDEVAEIIHYQEKHFNGEGYPPDPRKEHDIHPASRILKVALDFAYEETRHEAPEKAMEIIKNRTGRYDPDFVNALEKVVSSAKDKPEVSSVYVAADEIEEGMILEQNLHTPDGRVVLKKGQEITVAICEYLKENSEDLGLTDPVRVIPPKETPSE